MTIRLALSVAAAGSFVAAGIALEQLGRGVQALGRALDRTLIGGGRL